jgi:hypothetical protein
LAAKHVSDADRVRRSLVVREYDKRTGRPLVGGQDTVAALTDEELEVELTIAVAEPTRRAPRLDALLLELTRRRGSQQLASTT